MKSINIKNAAFTMLSIVLIGWLLLVWAPMIREDQKAFDNFEKVMQDSKSTVEKTRLLLDQIEKTTPLEIQKAPVENGLIL